MRSPITLLLPVLLIVGWEVAAYLIDNPFILPSLTTVIPILLHPFSDEFTLGTGSLVDNAAVSLFRVGSGFALAAFVAIPLGIVMGRSAILNDFLDTAIELLRPIPPLAWVPLALAWFKIGLASMVFIIFIGAFFPILLNTIDGVKSIKRTWVELAMTLGAREADILGKVILHGAAPTIWTGLRVGFGIAWMCVVAAEWLPGTTIGLGYLILYAYNFGQTNVIIAGMVMIGVIGIVIDQIFKAGERRWFSWRALER
ncbi:MAG TPA: ABC transporter permease [Methanoregulaceae archaeon]|nr:MAG: ABC transporter permease [Methanolinea sp.]HON81406.1 ABC transporter permease [Methanoregulaceae archaeon]HPD10066.1 ABC transporter permease [Methanoregulaceae archaeon]HRT15072.1 ABC transporter permease [Methanoregulaceae archaeon]HRU30643.1 ABC transporter permease [Methanoregulaceae archaeon]